MEQSRNRPWAIRNLNAVLDWVYPSKCGLCGSLGKSAVCAPCQGEFEVHGEIDDREHFEYAYACFRYTGRVAQAVKRLKYQRITSLAQWMADEIAEASEREFPDFDIVVPVPIHAKRRRLRGFNQAELLCGSMDRSIVDETVLRRIVFTRPQAGLTPIERRDNLVGAFSCNKSFDRETVLLVDDVSTSGSTARECGRVLREAGARRVLLLTFASG